MAVEGVLAPLMQALGDLVAWLEQEKVPGMLIGGVAASLLGRPRMTKDVDAVILLPEDRWEGFLAAGERRGFPPRFPDTIPFARKSRVFLVRHEASGTDVDIAIAGLPFEEEALGRAQKKIAGPFQVPLPLPDDLLVMKAVAHRPRDLEDIRGILDANTGMDLEPVRARVAEFSSLLEAPEILRDFESLLLEKR